MVNELLKFRCRPLAIAQCEIGFPADINRDQQYEAVGLAKFYCETVR